MRTSCTRTAPVSRAFNRWLAPLLLCMAGAAYAGGDHSHGHGHGHAHQAQRGGVVVEAGGMDFELVAKPDLITLHVSGHGKPVSTQGGTAKLTILQGLQKSKATLTPTGDTQLAAKGLFNLKSGTKILALVSLPGKKPVNVRFALP